jgi:hypothetical protein
MTKTVFEVLDAKFKEQQQVQENHLISGGVKDFAEYRDVCGAIRGLAIARREVADLAKHVQDIEEN